MPEQQIEIRCPGCGARYWVEPAQMGTEVECGQCHRKFAVTTDLSEPTVAVTVKLAFDDEPQRSNVTISSYMRDHGVQGGVSLEESGGSSAARDVLETDSGRKYAVGNMVARGGMGAILNCRDLNVRRNVAMKVMLNPEKVEQPQILRFIEEAQVTGQLEHPGVVPVYELGVDAGSNVFYTMKFVRGRTLKDILKDLSRRDAAVLAAFPLSRLLNVFLRVCEAMAYAHHKHVLHRDLKPENIMIGDFGEVYVMDWGLAKVMSQPKGVPEAPPPDLRRRTVGPPDLPDAGANRGPHMSGDSNSGESVRGPRFAPRNERAGEAMPPRQGAGRSPDSPSAIDHARKGLGGAGSNTLDGAVMGTPSYMAPEQARGKVSELDARADVYALGGILYEILSLHRAVDGKDVRAILTKVVRGEITPLAAIRGQVSGVRCQESKTETRNLTPETSFPHCPGGQIPAALAAVAMKALALHPDDRYQTVKELQADIEAYQAGFATSAEHAGLLRLLLLFVNRHRTAAISAAAIVLALTVGLAVALAQWRKAVRAELAEAQQRRVAESALERAEQENYYNSIGLAEARINDSIVSDAEALLWTTPPARRGWEWGNLLLRCHQELLTIPTGAPFVSSVAFSPDGRSLVFTNGAGITVWDMVRAKAVFTAKGHSSQVQSVAWSPDGRTLLSGASDGTARLWDAGSGVLLRTFTATGKQVMCVAYAPDSRRVAMVDDRGHLFVWDTTGESPLLDLVMPGTVFHLCYSPDGQTILASGPGVRATLLLDVTDGRQIRSFPGGAQWSCFSPDGRLVAVRNPRPVGASIVDIWDLRKATVLVTLHGHEHDVCSAAFSPDSRLLVTGSADRTVCVWDTDTGRQTFAFPGHSRPVRAVAFSPDGRTIASAGHDGVVKLWLAAGPFEPRQVGNGVDFSGAMALSPDGRSVIVGGSKDARILDVASGQCKRELKRHTDLVWRVAWSRDGDRVLTVSYDKTARIWDPATGRLVVTLEGHTDKVVGGAFSPDAARVLTCGGDGTARVWDVATGHQVRRIDALRGGIHGVAWAPDGCHFATAEHSGPVRIWDANDETVPPRSTEERGMSVLAFSADGRWLAGGDTTGAAFVWELPTLRRKLTLTGHGDWVSAVAFSPDGRQLVTGDRGRGIRLWNLATGRLLLSLFTRAGFRSLEFSADGTALAVGCANPPQLWHSLDGKATTPESFRAYLLERYREWLKGNDAGK